MWEHEDDFGGSGNPYQKKPGRSEMERETHKFRNAAYKGYTLLERRGIKAVDLKQREEAVLAIRRILGLMVMDEEYEKCDFLKNFLSEKLGQDDPTPIFDFKDLIL